MAAQEPTMSELAAGQGVKVCQPIRLPNTDRHPINFPSWVDNNLHFNWFMGSVNEDPHAYLMRF